MINLFNLKYIYILTLNDNWDWSSEKNWIWPGHPLVTNDLERLSKATPAGKTFSNSFAYNKLSVLNLKS